MNDFWKNAVDMPTLRTERNIKPRVSPIGFDSAVLVDDVLNANSRALWTNGPCCFFGHGAHLNWMVDGCLREVVQEIDWNDCLLKYEDLPKLLAAPDNLVGSALLADIAAACLQRLARNVDGLSSTCAAYRKRIKEMEQPALPEGQTRRIA